MSSQEGGDSSQDSGSRRQLKRSIEAISTPSPFLKYLSPEKKKPTSDRYPKTVNLLNGYSDFLKRWRVKLLPKFSVQTLNDFAAPAFGPPKAGGATSFRVFYDQTL